MAAASAIDQIVSYFDAFGGDPQAINLLDVLNYAEQHVPQPDTAHEMPDLQQSAQEVAEMLGVDTVAGGKAIESLDIPVGFDAGGVLSTILRVPDPIQENPLSKPESTENAEAGEADTEEPTAPPRDTRELSGDRPEEPGGDESIATPETVAGYNTDWIDGADPASLAETASTIAMADIEESLNIVDRPNPAEFNHALMAKAGGITRNTAGTQQDTIRDADAKERKYNDGRGPANATQAGLSMQQQISSDLDALLYDIGNHLDGQIQDIDNLVAGFKEDLSEIAFETLQLFNDTSDVNIGGQFVEFVRGGDVSGEELEQTFEDFQDFHNELGTNLDALKETIESYEQRIEEIEERIENAPHAVTPEMQSKLETARSELNEAKNAYDQYSNIHQRVAQFIKHGSDIDIKAAKQAAQDGHITQAEWQEMTADIDNPEVVDGIKQMFLENGVTFWDSEQSVPDGNDPGAPANSDVLPVTGIPFLDESLETVGSQFGNFGEKLLSEDSTQSTTEGDPSYAKQDTGSVAENYVPGGDRPLSIGHEFKKAHDGKTSPDKDNQPQLEHEQRPQRTAEQDTPAAEAQTFTV